MEVWTYDRQDVRCVESFVPSCDVTLSVSSWKPEPEMRLQQNYPNPFNPATTLLFDPGSRTYIVLEILDATGNVVQTAAEGFYEAGTHSASFDGEDLPSGIYFARLRSNGRSLIRAMMLLR